MIDIAGTREQFRITGRKYAAYAMAKGFNPSHWPHKMAGKVQFNEAELKAMKADGLLVETTN